MGFQRVKSAFRLVKPFSLFDRNLFFTISAKVLQYFTGVQGVIPKINFIHFILLNTGHELIKVGL